MIAERQARADAHLAVCSACQRRIEEFREVGRLLRERYPLVDNPQARARIVARSLELTSSHVAEHPGRVADTRRRLASSLRRLATLIRPNRRGD